MNFAESVDYLLSLGNEVSAMKLGLENIGKLLSTLGRPHEKYPKVQVAGTNGKGSVCAFLDSICRVAKIRTGLYTSPHLISIRERIKINGEDISEDEFGRTATLIRETSESLVSAGELESLPTFFEHVTAIALKAFAEKNVELAILETGLGGRLDATTAASAEIVAITRIDYDHQKILGDTLREIATEKAAIIRPGVPAVIGPQNEEAERVINGRCREVGVDPIWASKDFFIKPEREIAPMLYGTFVTEIDNYANVELFGMKGRHQFENASIAISIAENLRGFGLDISKDAIITGIENAKHPGRLEFFGDRYLLDGAHNLGGAHALREFLDEFVHQPITIIFGSMQGKDVSEMAEILFPMAARVVLTRPDNSRAMTAEQIEQFLPREFSADKLILTGSADEALEVARRTSSENHLILITGSLYLVGEAQRILRSEFKL